MPKQNMTPNYIPPLFNGLGALAKRFETKTASFTATAADSGKIFMIYGGTAAVTVTLPAIDTGPFEFTIINCQDQNLLVASAVADTLIVFNDLTADSIAFSTSSEKIGNGFRILCDGTKIVALPLLGSIYATTTIATA